MKNENAINNRYEFVMLYDVENGNPNGDPDADNMPRMDPETGRGIVTDVCIKRKIRNAVLIRQDGKEGFDIYIRQNAILKEISQYGIDKAKDAPKDEKNDTFRNAMMDKFYDIRTFGAVMPQKKGSIVSNTAGQVRGPVQIAFGQSVEPIFSRVVSITRMAVEDEKELKKKEEVKDDEGGKNNITMGRKAIVPYALYRQEGYISANLAQTVTGFSENDLEVFWDAIIHMFDEDRSAARGKMALRELFVFKHENPLGNAPAHKLFDRIKVKRKKGVSVARKYTDYAMDDIGSMPRGVELIRKYRDDE